MAESNGHTVVNGDPPPDSVPLTFESFVLKHKPQLVSLGIPNLYWQSLFAKVNGDVFDAGKNFMMNMLGEGEWEILGYKINKSNPESIFLIDHAWTYEIPYARDQLMSHPKLLTRMLKLMEIEDTDEVVTPTKPLVDRVLERMWQYNMTYSFSHEYEDEPLWYVMDEFGSRIQHSTNPNVKIGPFHFSKTESVYSVMWPLKDIDGEEVVRDFAHGIKDPTLRQIKLLPWYAAEHDEFMQNLDEFASNLDEDILLRIDTPLKSQPYEDLGAVFKESYTYYTDITLVSDTLKLDNFEFVSEKEKAEILWVSDHYRKFDELTPDSKILFINQFPFEDLFTCKHFMSTLIIARGDNDVNNFHSRGFPWLPLTFELNHELKLFVRCFMKRKELGLRNIWILKPVNKARGIDTHVTDDLDKIVRHSESAPKLACLYISDPMLFYRPEIGKVKIDIRYVVLLSKTDPLELYVHNMFWLRFGNKPYSLDSFDDYEKHFTVMNYKPEANLKTILSPEFMELFEQQYPELKWSIIEDDICAMIKEAFCIFFSSPPMKKVKKCERSKAVYAIDTMLEWCEELNPAGEKVRVPRPRLLEINYCPDTERACKFDPPFYNDIFSLLFLDKVEGLPFRKL